MFEAATEVPVMMEQGERGPIRPAVKLPKIFHLIRQIHDSGSRRGKPVEDFYGKSLVPQDPGDTGKPVGNGSFGGQIKITNRRLYEKDVCQNDASRPLYLNKKQVLGSSLIVQGCKRRTDKIYFWVLGLLNREP